MSPPQKREVVSNESSAEKCGFMCHVLCLPLTVLYLLWIWVPDDTLHAADINITYYPDKSWSIVIPVSVVGVFCAAPIIYSIVNLLSVPRVESIDTVRDDYTRPPPFDLPASFSGIDKSSVPEIYDLDVADVNDRIVASLQSRQR
jgi:hypothetical protein